MISKSILNKKKRLNKVTFIIKKNKSRPRLVLKKTNRYLIAQLIDDVNTKTLSYASTLEADFKSLNKKNIQAAETLGQIMADRIKNKGIKEIFFDRRGYIYHGRVAKFVSVVRENGLIL